MVKHILVSRTDAIGDVVLTLPLCGFIKSIFPGCKISFLGRTYTAAVVNCCSAVDQFLNADELSGLTKREQVDWLKKSDIDIFLHVFPVKSLAILAKKAGISLRIGTSSRWYHWSTCNQLVRLSRKKSDLHEAELNLRLVLGLGIDHFPALAELPDYYDFKPRAKVPAAVHDQLDGNRFNLVIHPRSHGSGAEWGLDRFAELIRLLPANRFKLFISGSIKEKAELTPWIAQLDREVIDLTGAMDLAELIAFYAAADGLIASGTGPLHLAAAAGIFTLGLFPVTPPIHAGRWAPVGRKATFISSASARLSNISTSSVLQQIESWKK